MSSCLFVLKVICTMAYITSLLANPHDELAQEFMDHMLQISSANTIWNTMLNRLVRSGRLDKPNQSIAKKAQCEDSAETLLPKYKEFLEPTFNREIRQFGPQKHYPICHLERKMRRLTTEDYEYRPAYLEEIRCIRGTRNDKGYNNEICASLGFSCVQWNKTIHLTRRLYASDCWETMSLVVPSGCECMWPVHRLGEMAPHL